MTRGIEMLLTADNGGTQEMRAIQHDRPHQNLERFEDRAKTTKDGITTEKTPLLKAEKNVVETDNDADPVALSRGIHIDEEPAVDQNQQQRASEIAWGEALGIFRLAIPMTGSQAMGVFPGILTGWFLGNAPGSDSAKVLAATSLASFVQGIIVYMPTGGIGSALLTVSTQSFGANASDLLHRVAPLVYVPVLANFVTLPLAYVLGFHTSLSYIGIALANVVNSILKVVMAIPFVLRTPAFVEGWPGWRWKEAHALMANLIPLGFSSILMIVSQNIGDSLIPVMCGYLPNTARAIAADNIAGSLLQLANVPLIGVGVSGGIRVGTTIGARKQRHAAIGSFVTIGITISVAALSAITCSAFAGSFFDGYTTDTPTADLATAVYPAQATLVVLLGWMFGIQSVLRACGKQAVIAKLNFLFLFVISIPLGLVFAIPLKLGLIGLYLGSIAGTIGLNVACSVYVYRFDWEEVAHEAYVNSHLHVEKEPESEPNA